MPGKAKQTVAKPKSSGTKRKRLHRRDGFSTYTYKVLKQVHPDTGISSKAMLVMEGLEQDIFNRLNAAALQLAQKDHKKTISSRDVQAAVRLVFPGELAKHAVSEGTKAVTKYNAH